MGDGRGIAKSPFPHSVLFCANNLANAAPHTILKEFSKGLLTRNHYLAQDCYKLPMLHAFQKNACIVTIGHTKLQLLLEI